MLSLQSRLSNGCAPSPVRLRRVATLYSGLRHVRRHTQWSAYVLPHRLLDSRPLVSAESRNGQTPARGEIGEGCPDSLPSRQRTRSAANSWFSRTGARKSLILEASAATSHRAFAINSSSFATSSIFALGRCFPFSSLSKTLREKEKESDEEQGITHTGPPRVERVLPSIADAAYFLCHEFHESESSKSWQLLAADSFVIKALRQPGMLATRPRFALRVVPSDGSPHDNQQWRVRRCRGALG